MTIDRELGSAVGYERMVLGEPAWRKELSNASRRGFEGCVIGIRVANSEELGLAMGPPPEPALRISVRI